VSGCAELTLPGGDHLFITAGAKGCIALMKRALISTPDAEELMFHVKHAPVEQATAACRSFFDQPVYTGIDNLDREDFGNLGDAGNPLPRQVGFRSPLAVLNAGNQRPAWRLDSADDAEKVCLGRQQLLALVRAKGTAVSEEIDCLEQARLARAILTDDARRPRIELEMSRTDAAEILDIDRGQHIEIGLLRAALASPRTSLAASSPR
jgi:hypothetical protein